MTIDEFKEFLRKSNYRVTGQRITVFETMQDLSNIHLNIEDIYKKASKKDSELGIATVYRTIALFLDAGIVQKTTIDGVDYYELVDSEMQHHHHHLVCRYCKKFIEVDGDLLSEAERKIEEKYDFIIENHDLTFYGLCSDCKERDE